MNTAQLNELNRIQRKLDAWELPHLRALAAHLSEQLEAAQDEIERLTRERDWADDRADMFHNMVHELTEETNAQICLHKSGAVSVRAAHV
jgi:uncharacterized coiled-coil DUF342 family protein